MKRSAAPACTQGMYTARMLYAKMYLSPYSHARIKSLDTKAVEAYPGVQSGLQVR